MKYLLCLDKQYDIELGQVDVENNGDLADFEEEIILRSTKWFYDILKDRIYDYLEFDKESE